MLPSSIRTSPRFADRLGRGTARSKPVSTIHEMGRRRSFGRVGQRGVSDGGGLIVGSTRSAIGSTPSRMHGCGAGAWSNTTVPRSSPSAPKVASDGWEPRAPGPDHHCRRRHRPCRWRWSRRSSRYPAPTAEPRSLVRARRRRPTTPATTMEAPTNADHDDPAHAIARRINERWGIPVRVRGRCRRRGRPGTGHRRHRSAGTRAAGRLPQLSIDQVAGEPQTASVSIGLTAHAA